MAEIVETGQPPMEINIVLEMPPGVNKLYEPALVKNPKTGRLGARIHKSAICKEWATYARGQVLYQRSGLTIPYRFKIELILPEAYTDSDAPIKETLDACQHGGAITDDKHCRGGTWAVDETRPRGIMLVRLIATDDPIPPGILKKNTERANQANLFA